VDLAVSKTFCKKDVVKKKREMMSLGFLTHPSGVRSPVKGSCGSMPTTMTVSRCESTANHGASGLEERQMPSRFERRSSPRAGDSATDTRTLAVTHRHGRYA